MKTVSMAWALLTAAAACDYYSVTIKSYNDGDTCTTTTGEKSGWPASTPRAAERERRPAPAMAEVPPERDADESTVGIRRITTDRYGRTVAELFIDGRNVQQAMVASGHTAIYGKYAHQCGWTR